MRPVAITIAVGGAVVVALPAYLGWRASQPDRSAFAWAGEQVTREDGTVICTLTRDLHHNTRMTAEGWCADWTIEPPKPNTVVPNDPPGHRWIYNFKLHVGDSWR